MKTLSVATLGLAALTTQAAPPELDVPRLQLERVVDETTGAAIEHGTFTVWENREAKTGRTLDLHVVILRALAEEARPDPVFFFAGGPGVAAAGGWRRFTDHWMRADRDIVIVNQRGTGGSNRIDCDAPGGPGDLQGYLGQVFENAEGFRDCIDALSKRADLEWYGTATAMDDLDELRASLGYEQINLTGGSYGSRAALEYVRRHGEHVRCAIVSGVAPVGFVNPLYHASAAQRALDIILDECAADPDCSAAYPDLASKFDETLARLEVEPGRATILVNEEPIELMLTRDGFAEALRMLMYFDSRRVPYLVQRAFDGDYKTFALAALQQNRAVRDAIAFGMLLCVTCNEDLSRIDRATIDRLTEDTFLGDVRVRQQLAVCELWPGSHVPADHGAPLVSDVPILMLSGHYDPVTPPSFAEDAAQHLPNALHIVGPGSHGLVTSCTEAIQREFLALGSADGIDLSCVETLRPGPFFIEQP